MTQICKVGIAAGGGVDAYVISCGLQGPYCGSGTASSPRDARLFIYLDCTPLVSSLRPLLNSLLFTFSFSVWTASSS
jgi:hypothetical protein